MTDETFATVRRGYDPAQVDSVLRRMRQTHAAALQEAATQTVEINKLNQALEASQGRVTGLQQQVSELQEQVTQAQSHASNGHGTDFTSLGERIAQMLTLAQEEADDIRLRAQEDAEAMEIQVAHEVEHARAAADGYATETRSKAEADAARVIEQANREADELLDHADREASARRREAEAVFEQQRAAAGAAAAEFEATLAERRERATAEFATQMANHERALAVANDKLMEAQTEATRVLEEAHASAAEERERAASEAKSRLENARIAAERVKRESERELSALAARRDSITEQLANVRQMLSTLGGSALSMNLAPASPTSPGDVAAEEATTKKNTSAKSTTKAR